MPERVRLQGEGRSAAGAPFRAAFLVLVLLLSLAIQSLHPLLSGCVCDTHLAAGEGSGPEGSGPGGHEPRVEASPDGDAASFPGCLVCALTLNPSPALEGELVLPALPSEEREVAGVRVGSASARGPPRPWTSRAPPAA